MKERRGSHAGEFFLFLLSRLRCHTILSAGDMTLDQGDIKCTDVDLLCYIFWPNKLGDRSLWTHWSSIEAEKWKTMFPLCFIVSIYTLNQVQLQTSCFFFFLHALFSMETPTRIWMKFHIDFAYVFSLPSCSINKFFDNHKSIMLMICEGVGQYGKLWALWTILQLYEICFSYWSLSVSLMTVLTHIAPSPTLQRTHPPSCVQ